MNRGNDILNDLVSFLHRAFSKPFDLYIFGSFAERYKNYRKGLINNYRGFEDVDVLILVDPKYEKALEKVLGDFAGIKALNIFVINRYKAYRTRKINSKPKEKKNFNMRMDVFINKQSILERKDVKRSLIKIN